MHYPEIQTTYMAIPTLLNSAGRYQKLSYSIYCLRLIHDMNEYCLLSNSAKFSYNLGGISHVNTS